MTGGRRMGPGDKAVIDRDGLDLLIAHLAEAGYRVIGPVVRDGAILYEPVSGVADLPAGWGEDQEAGRYRLVRRDDAALFGHTLGPHSWKRYLLPPRRRLWQARRDADGAIEIETDPAPPPRDAFLGVRACELAAIAVQDRVLRGGAYGDADYAARRDGAFLVAVNCGTAGGTCFCVSMETGPAATAGFDLALTELTDGGRHDFLIEVGGARGAEIAAGLPTRPAGSADLEAAAAATARAAAQMGRALDTDGLKDRLQANPDHARWDEVAARCLACGNCTQVCPTCFCSTTEETTSLDGATAERWKRWESCFTLDFSYLHGGSIRSSAKSRYRQWLTHKLADWVDQFGESGCVGCGRCITWCPVGIDITEEAAAVRRGFGGDGP